MATNKYFQTLYDNNEQSLFSDIIQENISIYGMDVLYIVKDNIEMDELLREPKLSSFNTTYKIDAYIEDNEAQNMQKYMSKFGFRFEDNTDIIISSLSWDCLGTGFTQPREGDLIYIGNPDTQYGSFINSMFQINQVWDNRTDTSKYGVVVSFRLSLSTVNKNYNNIMETPYNDINDMLNADVNKENKTTIKKFADEFADVNIISNNNPLTKYKDKGSSE